MAIADFYQNPAKAAATVILSTEEKTRRALAQRRLDIYGDNYEGHVLAVIRQFFKAPEVAELTGQFAAMACANSLLKRIVNDVARPIYATPPTRHVKVGGKPAQDQRKTYLALAREMDLDRRMALATCLTVAVNDLFLFVRYVRGAGMCLDVITPNQASVLVHPRYPSKALGISYDVTAPGPDGKPVTVHVVWDDGGYFMIDAKGFPLSGYTPHNFGRIPMVEVHRTARWGSYFDCHGGSDLEAASLQVALINALVLKLHYSQGERVLGRIGGNGPMPDDQTQDALNVLDFGDCQSVMQLDLVTDPSHYLKTKAEIETTVAANYGISRERLNQRGTEATDDVALRERTAEVMRVMRTAEDDLFDVVRAVSVEHPEHKLDPEASLAIDYGPMSERADRMQQLQIRKLERSMGGRCILDDVYEDNPEVADDDEAWSEVDRNMAAEAEYVLRRRALNIPEDATAENPGASPQQNGAMGPAVRDGKVSRDDAAKAAKSGDLRKIALRVLRGGKAA